MSLLKRSRCGWLGAAAVMVFWTPASGEPAGDYPSAGAPRSEATDDDRPLGNVLLAQRTERRRVEEEEARHLERDLEQVHQRIRELEQESGRLGELRRVYGPAHPAVVEEVERLKGERRRTEELHELENRQREIEGALGDRFRRGPPGRPDEDVERRLMHLEVAIDNLHAAGLHEHAERLVVEMERMRHGRPPRPGPREDPDFREAPPHPEQLDRIVQGMHAEVDELRRTMERELDQMRSHIERELDQVRRDLEARDRR